MLVVVLEEVLVIVVVVVLLEGMVSVLGELVVELVVVAVLEEVVVGLLMVLVVVVEGLEVEGLVKGLYPDPLPSPGPIQHQTSAPLWIASNQMSTEGASNQHTLPQACSRPDLGSSDPLTGGSTGEESPPAAGPRRVWRLEAEGGSLCSPPVNPFPIQLLP
ncbi:unnamed protein product [Gadus morhua 'NCC']